MKFNQDIQQAIPGFNTVSVHAGPFTVRVHEALDSIYQGNKYRYFISVDFKFRQSDALNIGNMGWYGMSKSEARREANDLCQKLTQYSAVANAARESALRWDIATNRITQQRQEDRLNKLVSKYSAEFVD